MLRSCSQHALEDQPEMTHDHWTSAAGMQQGNHMQQQENTTVPAALPCYHEHNN
jgi:hypothetical protein